MHRSVMEWGERVLTPELVTGKRIIEVGAMDVNGSLRPHCERLSPRLYHATDARAGRGVDEVITVEKIWKRWPGHFDLVISTEMLEHVHLWDVALGSMFATLAVGGHLLLTTRGPGFPRHEHPEDFWRFTVDGLLRVAMKYLYVVEAARDPEASGVFFLAKRVKLQPVAYPESAPLAAS